MAGRRRPDPSISVQELHRRLKKEAPAAVVIAAGSESWFRERVAEGLLNQVLPDGDPGGAHVRLDPRTAGPQDVAGTAIDELRSASLFAPQKLVVIEAAEMIEVGGKKGAPALDLLTKEAMQAAQSGTVLLLSTARPVKGKSAVPTAKLVGHGAWVVNCRALYDAPGPWERGALPHDHELARFVVRRMQVAYRKRIAIEDAHHLTQVVGSDLAALDGAMAALGLYVGDAEHVGAADIEKSIGETREDPIWRLGDAVFERRLDDALKLAGRAFDRGITDQRGAVVSRPEALAPMICATLFSSWRRVLAGAEGLARGEAAESVARSAGVPPFLSGPFVARCRRSPAELLAMSQAFYRAESGIKGGGVPHRLAIERLIVELSPRSEPSGSRR